MGVDEGSQRSRARITPSCGYRRQPTVGLESGPTVAAQERHEGDRVAELVEHERAVRPARTGAIERRQRLGEALLDAGELGARDPGGEPAVELQLGEVEVGHE